MKIKSATFVGSYPYYKPMPSENCSEFAFIGRSNVGKSSLINMLLERNELARTSSNPGKTQAINLFKINEKWNLVDLPGYGYAKVSKTMRAEFHKFITDYIEKREQLTCLFILIDSRHEPMKIDIEFINKIGEIHIPFVIIYTKIDKVKDNDLKNNIEKMNSKLSESWEELPTYYISSAIEKTGREEIMKFINTYII